jgi:ketosteroid isomerase-like protein
MTADDRLEIHELLSRWAYGYDEADIDLMAGCFTPDAVLEMRRPDVNPAPVRGLPAIVEMLKTSLASRNDKRRHFTTNTFFESEGSDRAVAVSFLVVTRVAEGERPAVFLTGVYHDELVKERRWRIRHRVCDFDNAFPSQVARTLGGGAGEASC